MSNDINVQRDTHVFICINVRADKTACNNDGVAEKLCEYFRQIVKQRRSEFAAGRIVKVNKSGCLGRCAGGPNLVIFPDNIWYNCATTDDINEILNEHIIKGQIVTRLLATKLS